MSAIKVGSNVILYKRKILEMGHTNQGQVSQGQANQGQANQGQTIHGQTNPAASNSNLKIIAGKILTCLGIAGGIITCVGAVKDVTKSVIVPITQHTDAISEIRSSVDDLDYDIKTLTKEVREMAKTLYTSSANGGKRKEDDQESKATPIQFINGNYPQMELAQNNTDTKNGKAWDNWRLLVDVVVAEDENGDKYTPPELANVTFVTSYTEGEKEIYFLGQYNEKGHWDGKCILNVYSKGILESILQGIYNDGKLYSYQRIADEKDGTWYAADLVQLEEYKEGEVWVYEKIEDYEQDISLDNYDQSKILDYDNFTEHKEGQILSYYNGDISNGYYNDNSGDAFLISYFKHGEIAEADDKTVIKTLYQGKFLDGYFVDESDSAWYITREIDTTYMYYEGPFQGGTAKNKDDLENYLSHGKIVEILKDKGFKEYSSQFFVEYSID